MRILHTADWHLGRIFHGEHLTRFQARVLDQFVNMARTAKPDLIVIAGDVYDRAVPPPEAVALLDETLARLAAATRAHIVIIAGNHDSPERLGFGAALMRAARVHVHGRYDPLATPLVVADDHGPVAVHALPFLEPVHTRAALAAADDAAGAGGTATAVSEAIADLPAAGDQAAMMRVALARAMARHPAGARAVLVAHAMVRGGRVCDSERALVIGGAEEVPADLFAPFHYVALGHLHMPQGAGRAAVRYAGSPMKYSFSEATHRKSATFVEMNAAGECVVETWPFTPPRDVRIVEGALEELLAGAKTDAGREDWLLVRLLDPRPVADAMERLRAAYPNVLMLERPDAHTPGAAAAEAEIAALAGIGARGRRDLEALFARFLVEMTGRPPNAAERAALRAALEDMRRVAREAGDVSDMPEASDASDATARGRG